ncbi:MAG: LytR/AlgR family response regulator transcription factor [Sellimonas intestinalis]
MMRLLIVDDEHYIVNYLAALVEAHAPEDLEVYKCYSGMEALELSKTMKIHLALLDIRMPGLSGIETASRIRTSDPDFRVIF